MSEPEAAFPDMYETRADGTHAPVIPAGWLDPHAKAVLRAVVRCADLDVSALVEAGVFEPTTALSILHLIRQQIAALDPDLAEQLVPVLTEGACTAKRRIAS